MTVSKVMAPLQYATDGVRVNFPYDDKIFEASDLEVYLLNAENQEERAVLDQDYTVTGVGLDDGGAVIFIIPPAANQILTIRRALPLIQTTNYVENDDFPAESHEEGLDKTVMLIQQLQEQAGRSLHLPPSIQLSGKLPAPAPNTVLAWDSLAQEIINRTTETLTVPQLDHIGNYGDSLAQAVSEIGAGAKLLMLNKLITLDSNLVVPKNIQLWPTREGRIRIVNCTLELQCIPECGPYQIFELVGTGAVTGLPSALPEWFGALGDNTPGDEVAVQACMNAAKVTCILADKIFNCVTELYPPLDHVIEGHGPSSVLYRSTTTGGSHAGGLCPYNGVTLRNFTLRGSGAAYVAGADGIIALYNNAGSWDAPGSVVDRDQADLTKWRGAKLKVEHVVIENWAANGLQAGPDSVIDNVLIRDCLNEGMLIQGDRCGINFPRISNCPSWAIDLNCSYAKVMAPTIQNCGQADKVVVAEDGGGIMVNSATHINGAVGNEVYNPTIDTSDFSGITVLAPALNDYVLRGTVIFNPVIRNVCLNTTNPDLSAINITDNSVSGTKLTDTALSLPQIDTVASGHGIYIFKTIRTSIQGYNIKDPFAAGIYAYLFKDLTITGPGMVRDFGTMAYSFNTGSNLALFGWNVVKTDAEDEVGGVRLEAIDGFDIGHGYVELDPVYGYGVFNTRVSGRGSVHGVRAKGCLAGIYDDSTGDFTRIIGNDLGDNVYPMQLLGTHDNYKVRDNEGYRSEMSGVSPAIASGATFPHYLAAAPAFISVTPAEAGPTDVTATADADNITVNFGGGGSKTFYWAARIAQSK
jgi:hypothetical protein